MKTLPLFLLLLVATISCAQPSHRPFSEQLNRFVSEKGEVDYAAWKKAESQLDTYLRLLAREAPEASWSRPERMAYWINAYNAFTVKLILQHYPVQSIRDLHDGDPWDVEWIELGGKSYSLNRIEHDILRPRFGDARIHFAVNCAAASCPPLRNEAFTAEQLDAQLEAGTRAFINDPHYNRIRPDRLELSRIFDWYGEDFGDLPAFIDRYVEMDIAADARIEFLEYDWGLNGS